MEEWDILEDSVQRDRERSVLSLQTKESHLMILQKILETLGKLKEIDGMAILPICTSKLSTNLTNMRKFENKSNLKMSIQQFGAMKTLFLLPLFPPNLIKKSFKDLILVEIVKIKPNILTT